MLLHPLSTLLRQVRAVINTPPASLTPPAGPAGSEAIHVRPAGLGQNASMDRRPAPFSRRAQDLRGRKHPTLGAIGIWRIVAGELRYARVQKQWDRAASMAPPAAQPIGRLIPVLPPTHPLPQPHGYQVWRTLAPLSAGRPGPFHRLFAGNR